jgi:hypothetical protein
VLPVPTVVDASLELALREEKLSAVAADEWKKLEATLLMVAHPRRKRVNSVSRPVAHSLYPMVLARLN